MRSSWRFPPTELSVSSTCCQQPSHLVSKSCMCLWSALSTRAGSSGKHRDSKRAPGTRWTGDLAPVYVLMYASGAPWDVDSLETQAKNSMSVPSSAFPASTFMETRETCSSLGTQPGHALCKSSWPPLKAKGSHPRTPAGNWRCGRAAGAAQLCWGFCQQ